MNKPIVFFYQLPLFIILTLCSSKILYAETILILGDSISASYGISQKQGWVNLLENDILIINNSIKIINASVSGETTTGGLTRLPKLLEKYKPSVLLIELGGNDGLRGMPLTTMERNLISIISIAKKSDIKPLLLGIEIPPNYGRRYTQGFKNSFVKVAEKTETPLLPFLLDGVALDKTKMQSDGLHPNEKGQPIIKENVLKFLKLHLPKLLN